MTRELLPALLLLSVSCATADPVSIHTGMTLGEIERRILDRGGRRIGETGDPWTGDGGRAGHHVVFELPGGARLRCRVESRPSEAARESGFEVIRFELGPDPDYPMKIDLADPVYVPPSQTPR